MCTEQQLPGYAQAVSVDSRARGGWGKGGGWGWCKQTAAVVAAAIATAGEAADARLKTMMNAVWQGWG